MNIRNVTDDYFDDFCHCYLQVVSFYCCQAVFNLIYGNIELFLLLKNQQNKHEEIKTY